MEAGEERDRGHLHHFHRFFVAKAGVLRRTWRITVTGLRSSKTWEAFPEIDT